MGSRGRCVLGAPPNIVAHLAPVRVLFNGKCLGRTEATLALCGLGLLSFFAGLCGPGSIHECLVAAGPDRDSISARGKKHLVKSRRPRVVLGSKSLEIRICHAYYRGNRSSDACRMAYRAIKARRSETHQEPPAHEAEK